MLERLLLSRERVPAEGERTGAEVREVSGCGAGEDDHLLGAHRRDLLDHGPDDRDQLEQRARVIDVARDAARMLFLVATCFGVPAKIIMTYMCDYALLRRSGGGRTRPHRRAWGGELSCLRARTKPYVPPPVAPPYNNYFVDVVGTRKYCYNFSH